MFFYFQPLYLQQLGADPVAIGAIMGAYGAAMAVAHFPAGYLSDRIGRRPLLWASYFLGLTAVWIMALAANASIFIAGMLLYGFTYFVLTPMNSYASAARGSLTISQAIMLISGTFNFGMVFGPLLGGFVGEQWGLQRIYLVAGFFFFASTLLVLFLHPQPVEHHPTSHARISFLGNKRYVIYLTAVFIVVFSTYLPQSLSQVFLENERGLSLATIGLLTSMAGLGTAGLNLVFSRFNNRSAFMLAQAAVGGFAFLIWQGMSLPWYALGYFLLGGYKSTRSLATAQVRSLIPSNQMGTAYGVLETAGSTATILAPVAAGLLYTHNPTWIFSGCIVLVTFSLIISYFLSPSPSISLHPDSAAVSPEE